VDTAGRGEYELGNGLIFIKVRLVWELGSSLGRMVWWSLKEGVGLHF